MRYENTVITYVYLDIEQIPLHVLPLIFHPLVSIHLYNDSAGGMNLPHFSIQSVVSYIVLLQSL